MNIYSTVSEDGGKTFSAQSRVNDQLGDVSANVEQPPRVAVSSSEIAVVWTSKKSGASAIRMSRSKDGGKTFSPAVTIHSPSLTGARGWESVAFGPDGRARVVWLDGRNAQASTPASVPHQHQAGQMMNHGASPRQDVYSAVIDKNNRAIESQVATNVCFCCKTAVAILPGGRVLAAWRNIFPGSIRDIAVALSNDGGEHYGELARVSEDKWEIAGCPEDGPAVAVADAVVHIIWPTVVNEPQPHKAVFYSTSADGRTFSPRVRLSRPDQEEAAHPQIAIGKSGTVAVVWDEPGKTFRQGVVRILGTGGQARSGRNLNSAVSASHPVIAPISDGFLVAWTSGEGTDSAIVVDRVAEPRAEKAAGHAVYEFRGRVVSVDQAKKALTVDGENVEGWMAAMTMMYRVDNPEVLARLRVGDRITATVRDSDFQTLHAVAIAKD